MGGGSGWLTAGARGTGRRPPGVVGLPENQQLHQRDFIKAPETGT